MDIETLREVAREILPWEQKRWLHRALEILRRDFWQIGETLHSEIDISVGFPHHDVSHNWFGTCREGPGYYSIFINPTVGGLEALDILVHELVHYVLWTSGHPEYETYHMPFGWHEINHVKNGVRQPM